MPFLDLLPSVCWVCHAWPSQAICPDCVQRFASPQPRCQRCALPLAEPVPISLPLASPLCKSCLALERLQEPGRADALDSCTACVDYDFPWASCVVDFKFHQAPAWAPVFAALMQLNPLLEAQLETVAHVLPMPLSKASLRVRGYNQALELARALSPERTRPQWLMKLRETTAQSELKGAARLRNLDGALALEPMVHRQIKGARVLLIDDVMTTGTTLREAAQRLRQCGASEVHAAVFARTLAPDSGWAR